jgi:EAL domain-containing protein (putative c-di-GMP-specific phosphodiesterase class I)
MMLHYQPLYAADGATLVGYEALARWTHPTRGNVPPNEFIPVAEETGLIESLGRWVLRNACAEAATWPAPLAVAVNLSAAQFRNDALVRTVIDTLGDTGLAAERLELEITESLLMVDTDRVVRSLHALSALGVRIAMDDFGTGYSSLAYLWRFPFDKVKIDRAFTKGLAEDPKVNLIVRSIVSLAHALQIRVNAEGVESEGQMRALQKHGCDELQGFLLGKPKPSTQLVHDNAAANPPARPDMPETGFHGLPTMPAPL